MEEMNFANMQVMDTSHIKRKWLDLTYANQSDRQKLDIYLPDKGNGPFPIIMVIHGGAWLGGNKNDMQKAPMLAGLKRGYAVVCINYRLSDEAQFPSQIIDCKAAVRYIKANARKYFMDKNRMGVWGASAGGHLDSLLGTSAGVKELEYLSMGNPNESCSVQAVIDWCGPTEYFLKMDEQFKESGMGIPDHSAAESPESKLLGKKITEVPELVKFASPMTYITSKVPPFLIQHGAKDPIVPVQQSINFATELKRVAGREKVILEVLEGVAHHGDPAFETEKNVKRNLDFFDLHLQKK